MLPGGLFQYGIETLTPSRWNCKFTWCHRYHMCHVNRDSLTHCSQRSVALLVEQRTSNPKVVGSTPTWVTEFFNNLVGHYQCWLSSLMLPGGFFQYGIETLTPSRWNCKFTWCHRYHMCHVNRDSLMHCSQGSVAQLVEQQTRNPKVVGSYPTWATEFFINSVGHYQCWLSSLMLPWGWFQYRIETLTPSWWNCMFTLCHSYHMCHVNRDSLTHCYQGSEVQLVEQRTSNPKAVGSYHTWATEFFNNSVALHQC